MRLSNIDVYQSSHLLHLVAPVPNTSSVNPTSLTPTPQAFRVISMDRTDPSPVLADIVYVHPEPLDRRELGRLLRTRPNMEELRRGNEWRVSAVYGGGAERRHQQHASQRAQQQQQQQQQLQTNYTTNKNNIASNSFNISNPAPSTTPTSANTVNRDDLALVVNAVALLGIVRFLKGFHLLLVTEHRRVGYINGHVVYGVQQSRLHSIYQPIETQHIAQKSWTWLGRHNDPMDMVEERYLSLFQFVDLTKDFYFSYTYDLTNTTQTNLSVEDSTEVADDFMWNHFLTKELVQCMPGKSIKVFLHS